MSETLKNEAIQKLRNKKHILLLGDYHTDFWQLAADPAMYGFNIECEVTHVDFTKNTVEVLQWIDIYAGKGNINKHHDGRVLTVTGHDGLEVEFVMKDNYVLCYPECTKLYADTLKECARLWAKINKIDVATDGIFFGANRYENPDEICEKLYEESQKICPEQAVANGFDTSEIQAVPPHEEKSTEIDDITIQPLTEEQIKQIAELSDPETAQKFVDAINKNNSKLKSKEDN
ncbi:MAG: hypothetical protein K5787_18930 [Lentisphaeria bacterium]|nr:hypothetical protein [Lentisphaeria bacterium]